MGTANRAVIFHMPTISYDGRIIRSEKWNSCAVTDQTDFQIVNGVHCLYEGMHGHLNRFSGAWSEAFDRRPNNLFHSRRHFYGAP